VFARGRDPYFPAWPMCSSSTHFQRGSGRPVMGTVSEIADSATASGATWPCSC